MEVKLNKRYPVQASLEQAWAVLSDIHATAACMPGAQITEQIDATHYKGSVKSKVGPATMMFQGDIEVQGIDVAKRELQMLGKGADKGGSSAAMQLHAHLEPGEGAVEAATEGAGGCVLVGTATVTVSGKLAQFGSRLLVPVSDAMLAQFADNFRVAAAAVPAPGATVAAGLASAELAGGTAPPAEPAGPLAADSLGAPGAGSTGAATAPSAAVSAPTASAAPRPVLPVKELNALSLMWTVIRGWFAGLFGKRT